MNKSRTNKSTLSWAIGAYLLMSPALVTAENLSAFAMGQEASVSESLGEWAASFPEDMKSSLSKITALTTKQAAAGVSISIQATGKIQYTAFKLYNPPRLVLDLPQMQEGNFTKPIQVNKGSITDIRPMYFGEAQVLRLEIALNKEVPHYNISKPEKNKLLVTLGSKAQETSGATAAGKKQEDKKVDLASGEPSSEEKQQRDDPLADSCDRILSGKKEKLSLDFQKANLRRILGIIAETGGFNLVFSNGVSGTLAMRLANVPWNQVFSKILRNNGLARECFGNIVRVLPKTALASEQAALSKKTVSGELLAIDPCEEIFLGNKSKISFDFKQANLRNILRFVSEIGGFNLMISPSVNGTLTMKLSDVPWNLALFMILRNNGLDQECSDSIMRVASRSVLNQEKQARLAAEKAKPKAKVKALAQPKKFGNELSVLKPIPFELYRNIQKNDPHLHENLEHYSKLFKDKSQLEAMGRKGYISLVKFYKQLIEKANGQGIEMQGSPLQVELASMKLVGVLWNEKEPIALIETQDGKGHTVRPGSMMGPNFGVVESIEPGKITIIERSRDYLGNIKSNAQEMDLFQKNKAPQEKS